MKLEDIQKQWAKDVEIDETNLGKASLDIPRLHSKYYNIYSREKQALRQIRNQYKSLYRARWEYYTNKATADVYEKEPLDLHISKQNLPIYLDSDEKIQQAKMRLDLQEVKVDFLQNIIDSINKRNWVIRNAIDWQKFINGQ